ncbi:unnamed protein product [Closterium sp. NIES-53]
MTTLWVLLHVAAQRDYELHSLDFSTAFLQGSLHEEIWLRRPPGFTGSFPPGTQWSLRRPVYGLHQAPREWHDTLRTTLAALGFAPSTADPTLFLRTNTLLPPFYILVYVDNLVFATADTAGLAHVNESRDDRFPGQFFFVSTQAPAGPEKDEGFEEPAAVGKVTLHSLDYWVINSGATYSMTPRADLLTELEPSPVKHVTSALGQRAKVKGMGKAMFKGADGKMVSLKNVLWVPNLAANLISVRRLQKAGMDTSSKGAKTYTARLGERILWDLHEDRDVYNEMWQIPVVPMPKERQVAASISTKGEAVGSGDSANGRAKEIKSKKCNLGGTSKFGEHEESGAAAQKQHKGEENPKAAAEEEYGENIPPPSSLQSASEIAAVIEAFTQ